MYKTNMPQDLNRPGSSQNSHGWSPDQIEAMIGRKKAVNLANLNADNKAVQDLIDFKGRKLFDANAMLEDLRGPSDNPRLRVSNNNLKRELEHFGRVAGEIEALEGRSAVLERAQDLLNRIPDIENLKNAIADNKKTLPVRAYFDALETICEHLHKMGPAPVHHEFPRDIPCPMKSIVTLHGHPIIHANKIVFDDRHHAIAAQQPHNDKDNFWQFAAEKVDFILDLRRPDEAKSYHPQKQGKQETHGGVNIKCKNANQWNQAINPWNKADRFSLEVSAPGKAARTIECQHFKHWPDHGVIKSAQLRELGKMLADRISNGQKVLVHCRAGVGRTGTILTYARLYNQLVRNNPQRSYTPTEILDHVTQAVMEGRQARGTAFVQEPEQLGLIIKTLVDDLKNQGRIKPEPQVRPEVHVTQLRRSVSDGNIKAAAGDSPRINRVKQANNESAHVTTIQAEHNEKIKNGNGGENRPYWQGIFHVASWISAPIHYWFGIMAELGAAVKRFFSPDARPQGA